MCARSRESRADTARPSQVTGSQVSALHGHVRVRDHTGTVKAFPARSVRVMEKVFKVDPHLPLRKRASFTLNSTRDKVASAPCALAPSGTAPFSKRRHLSHCWREARGCHVVDLPLQRTRKSHSLPYAGHDFLEVITGVSLVCSRRS